FCRVRERGVDLHAERLLGAPVQAGGGLRDDRDQRGYPRSGGASAVWRDEGVAVFTDQGAGTGGGELLHRTEDHHRALLARGLIWSEPPAPSMRYTAENLLVRPASDPADPDLILRITPERAGWDFISFEARRLSAGRTWSFDSGEHEVALVNLSGRYRVESNRGVWTG